MKQQTLNFNGPVNSVTVNRYSHQSKDIIKNVRLAPDNADEISKICFDKNITFADFNRVSIELGKVFYDHADTLLGDDVQKWLLPMIESVTTRR